MVVDLLQPTGLGQLNQAFEALKARLMAEGLFDPASKRPLPTWPRRVGIVTSADAAALRDILRTLKARYALVDVLLASTLVQGSEAPAQIAEPVDQPAPSPAPARPKMPAAPVLAGAEPE